MKNATLPLSDDTSKPPTSERTASSILDEGFRSISTGPAHAITLAREALDRSEETGDKRSIARAHFLLASGLRRTGDVINALDVLTRTEELCDDLGDRTMLGQVLQQRAGILTTQGRPDEAAEALTRAQAIATSVGDTETLNRIYTTWALVYMRMDRYAEAIEMLHDASKLFSESPDPQQELVVVNLFASVYQRSRNHELAIDYLERALRIARDLEASGQAQPRLHCSALICLIDSLKDLGRFPEMLAPLEETRALAEKYDLVDVQASVGRGFGDHDMMEKRFHEAIVHYLHAKELLEATGNRMILMTVLHSLGECSIRIGDYSRATEYLNEALKASRSAGNLEKEFTSHKLLSELFTAQNDMERANQALRSALDSHEQLFNESNQRALRETEKRIVEEAARREHVRMRTQADELTASHNALQSLNDYQTEILHIVSHDMRNPLSAIYGMAAELAMDDSLSTEDARNIGKIIHDSSQKLISLTDQLLLAAQLEIGSLRSERSDVHASDIIQECLRLIRPQAIKKQVTVSASCQCHGKLVSLDVERFSHIVNNLLSNAVKFTNAGGSVRINCSITDHTLLLSVKDSGIGIPDELLASLFDQFNHDRRPGTSDEKGSGLGLPLVKKLVELEGGRITVRSSENQGTEFEAAIPVIS